MPEPTPQTLECPNCGAAVRWKNQPTVQCEYCGSEVIVPSELRSQPPPIITTVEPPQINITVITPRENPHTSYKAKQNTSTGGILFFTFLLMAIGIAAGLILNARSINLNNQIIVIAQSVAATLVAPEPTPTPKYAPLLRIGEEGSDSGQFTNARYLSIAPADTLWVAESNTGRVQKFSLEGTYLNTVLVPPKDPTDRKIYINGIGVDAANRLYVSREGDILQFDGATGSLLATFPGNWPNWEYYEILVGADRIYALDGMAGGDTLFILDTTGKQLVARESFIRDINPDDPVIDTDWGLSPDGTRLYIVSAFGKQLYWFNAQTGEFVDRYGENKDDPGGFSLSSDTLAVHPQGLIFVSVFGGFNQYTAEIGFQTQRVTFEPGVLNGGVYDAAFDAYGNLYILTTNNEIVKFPPPIIP